MENMKLELQEVSSGDMNEQQDLQSLPKYLLSPILLKRSSLNDGEKISLTGLSIYSTSRDYAKLGHGKIQDECGTSYCAVKQRNTLRKWLDTKPRGKSLMRKKTLKSTSPQIN